MAHKDKASIAHHGHHGRPVLLDLASFCVFNSNLGPKEGEEHKKILFFFPPETDVDKQVRHVGLMEAVGRFVRSFTDNDCRSVRTSQLLHVLHQPEKDFWVALTLNIQRVSEYPKGEGDDMIRIRDEQPQDDTYYGILVRSYKMFKLFCGSMSTDMSDRGIRILRQHLRQFFGNYFTKTVFNQFEVLQRFEAMSYLPIERNVFLNVQSFMNSLFVQFSMVKHALMLFWDFVVWNDLELQQAETMSHYVTNFLIPDQLEKERQAIHSSSLSNQYSSGHYGRFCPSVFRLSDSESPGVPAYLLDPESDDLTQYGLLIYSASSVTVCLFLNAHNGDLLRRLDTYLSPALTLLATNLADQCAKVRNPTWTYDSPYVHYVYLNEANLSKKQTLVDKTQSVQVELLKALASFDEDIKSRPDDAEVFAKVLHDCWIYGKRNFDKRLYAIVTQRNADLVLAEEYGTLLFRTNFCILEPLASVEDDGSNEIKKLCAKEFPATYDYYA